MPGLMSEKGSAAPKPELAKTKTTTNVINFRIGGPQDDHAVCQRMVDKAKQCKTGLLGEPPCFD